MRARNATMLTMCSAHLAVAGLNVGRAGREPLLAARRARELATAKRLRLCGGGLAEVEGASRSCGAVIVIGAARCGHLPSLTRPSRVPPVLTCLLVLAHPHYQHLIKQTVRLTCK
jgi:hypothetical protein